MAFSLAVVFNASGMVTLSLGTSSAAAVIFFFLRGILRFIRALVVFILTGGVLSCLVVLAVLWWVKYKQ